MVTDKTLAEKLAELAPAATVTDAGTVTEVLLLLKLTANPPLGAEVFNVRVQASVPEPVIDAFVQESPVSTGNPVPPRLTAVELLVEELLAMVKVPLMAPAETGLNCTVSVALWLGLSVKGKLAPEIEKPVPAIVAELIVTAEVPVDERVIDCEADELTATLPKFKLDVLTVSVATAGFN